jgi:hypothetical protein
MKQTPNMLLPETRLPLYHRQSLEKTVPKMKGPVCGQTGLNLLAV